MPQKKQISFNVVPVPLNLILYCICLPFCQPSFHPLWDANIESNSFTQTIISPGNLETRLDTQLLMNMHCHFGVRLRVCSLNDECANTTLAHLLPDLPSFRIELCWAQHPDNKISATRITQYDMPSPSHVLLGLWFFYGALSCQPDEFRKRVFRGVDVLCSLLRFAGCFPSNMLRKPSAYSEVSLICCCRWRDGMSLAVRPSLLIKKFLLCYV